MPTPVKHVPRAAGFLILVALLQAVACSPTKQRPPNVLLIVLDTTRGDAVSVHGTATGDGLLAPLQRLAQDGVVFSAARTVSAWTLPSHGSMFTGLYPSRHGAHHESHLLRDDLQTLAELLAPTHATAGFSENPHINAHTGFAQGFEVFTEAWRKKRFEPTVVQVRDWLGTRERERPFFLFVNLMDAHLPYRPSDELLQEFLPPGTDPADVQRMRSFSKIDCMKFEAGELRLPEADLAILRALYRAAVRKVEAHVDRLVDLLEQEGELDRTLVIVVGDHGENVGEHGLMQHQFCLYDSLLRVPLVLRLPGVFDGGERRDDPVQVLDLPPTVLDVVGVPRHLWPSFEGVSLLSRDLRPERPIIAEYMRPETERRRFRHGAPDFDFDPLDRRLQSYQVGDLKLIRDDQGRVELYDLSSDPHERTDVSTERPQDVERLSNALDTWLRSRETARTLGEVEMDEETLEELRALGYL